MHKICKKITTKGLGLKKGAKMTVSNGMKSAKLCALLALLGGALCSPVFAADTGDDLPPVPFIIGGDDVMSPASLAGEGPLVLPEGPMADLADTQAAQEPLKPISASSIAASASSSTVNLAPSSSALSAASASLAPSSSKGPSTMLRQKEATKVKTSAPAVAVATPAVDNFTSTDLNGFADLDSIDNSSLPMMLPPADEMRPAFAGTTNAMPTAANTNEDETTTVVVKATLDRPTGVENINSKPQMNLSPVVDPAPVAVSAPVTPVIVSGTSAGMLPGYTLEEPKRQVKITGADGVEQIKDIAHVVGQDSNLLPAVTVAPAVAVVGRPFPELHVDQISLEDLVSYLKDFTPKTIRYELPNPVYVSVELKANSVEEVMQYLMARYPLEVTSDYNSIFLRPAIARAITPVPMPVAASGPQTMEMLPVGMASVPTVPSSDPYPYYSQEDFAAPVVGASTVVSMPEPSSVANRWQEIRLKARLYELNKRRQALLEDREEIRSSVRKYDLRRATN